MFGQFYHETMRKYVIIFGTLFNNIRITRQNADDANIADIKVPLAYGCLLYTSPSPRDLSTSRMPSSA